MGNSLQLRAPTHYLRVDLNDPAEAEYWLLILDATRPQIETAIASVGRDARDVHAHLQSLRARSESEVFKKSDHAE
jgi:hypothetical protein